MGHLMVYLVEVNNIRYGFVRKLANIININVGTAKDMSAISTRLYRRIFCFE